MNITEFGIAFIVCVSIVVSVFGLASCTKNGQNKDAEILQTCLTSGKSALECKEVIRYTR